MDSQGIKNRLIVDVAIKEAINKDHIFKLVHWDKYDELTELK